MTDTIALREKTSAPATGSGSVRAEINYFVPNGRPAAIDHSGRDRTNVDSAPHAVDIADLRDQVANYRLDRQGFCLTPHRTQHATMENMGDMDALARTYHPEMATLLKSVTGARDIVPLRNGLLERRGVRAAEPSRSKPAHFAHVDYTEEWARNFILVGMAWEGVKELEPYSRFAIYQTWRVVSGPPQDEALAICDPSTVSAGDMDIVSVYPRPETISMFFQSQLVKYNPAHRWGYFSNMTNEEVLLFTAFDSDETQPRFVPHSAFRNPAVSGDVEPRSSIEARFLAFFE